LVLSYNSRTWKTSTSGNFDGHAFGEILVQEMVQFAKISQHGCPFVFICLNLGGLMVKEIIILAYGKFGTIENYKTFFHNIGSYLFYSRLHNGSHLVEYFKKMPNISKMVSQLEVIYDGINCLNSNFECIR